MGEFGQEVAFTWFRQAERDLKAARTSFEEGLFDLAAQQSRNASEKGLKAEWILTTARAPPETHSVSELSRLVGREEAVEEPPPHPRLGQKSQLELIAERCIYIAQRIVDEIRPKFYPSKGLLA